MTAAIAQPGAAARPRIVRLVAQTWRKLTWRQRCSLFAALILMAGTAGCETVVPLLIGNLISLLAEKSFSPLQALAPLAVIFLVMISGRLLAVGRKQIVETTATAYERDARIDSLEKSFLLPLSYYRVREVGAVNERISRGVEGSTKLLKLAFMDLFPAIILAAAAVAISFQGGVIVGIAAILVIPVGLWIVSVQIRSQDGIRTSIRDKKESIVGLVISVLPALDVVRSYGAEEFIQKSLGDGARGVRAAEMAHHRAMGFFDSLKSLNEAFFTTAVIILSILGVASGGAPIGSIMTSYLLFQKILAPLGEIHRMLDEASEAAKQTHDLFAFQIEPVDDRYTKEQP